MNVQNWEQVIAQSLELIAIADFKAWCYIVITLGISAGMVRMMMTYGAVMSKFTWFHSYLSIAVMGIGVLIGLEVIIPRGKTFEQRGLGVLNFRRGHLDDDKAFAQKAAQAKLADVEKEYQEFARDYFVILNTKFNFLAWCHRASVTGWGIACLTVMSVLQSLRNQNKQPKPIALKDTATDITVGTNGAVPRPHYESQTAKPAMSSGAHA